MRGYLSFLLLILTSVPEIVAQSSLSPAIAELPTCAVLCLVNAIENSTCSATNQTCICTNEPLQVAVTACVEGSCTIKEALTTKNITDTTCGAPVRDKSGVYNTLSNTLGSISGAVVAIRLFSKFYTGSEFGLDDYFITITLITGIPSSVLTVHGLTSNGLGRDIWTVTFKQITAFIHVFYAIEILYFSEVALLKLSLLFFYLRIFPGTNIRRLIWATIAFDTLFGLVFVFVAIFQCRPIDYYWKSWDGEHQGKCLNINALGWANAGISILLDTWMLGLPMSQLVHLNLHWKKKVGVALMFIVGTFVTVVSILRLQSLLHFAKSTNPTWDNFSVSQWSTVEINVGIICACMPSLRVLLVQLFPKLVGTTHHSNKYYAQSSQNHTSNISANRSGKSATPRQLPVGGIQYSQSYIVQYGNQWEHDEARLVQMDDLGPEGIKSSTRVSENKL